MRILLTAFEPYDEWTENSSWLALMELLKTRPPSADLITRRYPVDLPALQEKLFGDLEKSPDVVLHLGQAPGNSAIKLEAIALNIAGCVQENGQELPALVPGGDIAFHSRLPLGRMSDRLRQAGIPASVSYHAGTFLCNATMYLSHHWYHSRPTAPRIGFVHLPLATEQVAHSSRNLPSLPVGTLAAAVRLLVDELSE